MEAKLKQPLGRGRERVAKEEEEEEEEEAAARISLV